MDLFEQEILELINHCQKTDMNFNLVYKNALQSVGSQNTGGSHKIKEKITLQQMKKQLKSGKFRFAIGLFLILSIIYYQQDVINTHATAIGRILMIQLLPYYDWRPLKRERCFLKSNAFFATDNERQNKMGYKKEDCNYCDGINYASKLKCPDGDTKESILNLADEIKSYYDIDAPILITNTSGKSFKLEDIQNDLDYTQYIPCDVESNVFIRKSSSVEDILTKLTKAPFYYAHWRNCNTHAMKLFRRFFPRPEYLHVNFAPIQQSWMILHKKHQTQNYKQIKVGDRLSLVALVKGHLNLRLTPTRFCFAEKLCNDIFFDMSSGDALVVSDQWEIDYLWSPDDTQDSDEVNMAIVLETH